MLKALFWFAAMILLAGCGTAYVSPDVLRTDENISVIKLTSESVRLANQDIYTPRQIPDAFFQNAGSPDTKRSTEVPPAATLSEQLRPASLVARLPPPYQIVPYTIGVGDVVLLSTRSSGSSTEELQGLLAAQNSRQGYTIQDDGAIAVPDVGRIALAGLTLEEAEAQLFQSLIANRVDPTFSLEIAEFNSKRVSVGGAVAAPMVVPISLTPLSLDEALTRSGGIVTPDVDFAAIRIYRSGELYQIPLTQYLRDPDLQKTGLAAGDHVFVDTAFELDKARAYFEEQITLAQFRQQSRTQALAELTTELDLRRAALAETRGNFQDQLSLDALPRDYVYLTGEIATAGRMTLPFDQQATLADALFHGGGFSNETGNPSQIYLLRSSENAPDVITAWHLDARNVANMLLATRLNLRPNDIIFVAEQPITRWNRFVQQLVPSLITTGIGVAVQ